MKSLPFVNRSTELGMLASLASRPGANLVIVYGRRRVGKTTLLQEFCKARGGMYLVARQGSNVDQLQHLSVQVARFLDDRVLAVNPLRSWDAFFTVIVDRCRDVPVIIDEFPYLVESTKELPSILQEYWDNQFSKRGSFLILCGSSVGMMESFLGYRSPIYGRRTGQILLEPLGFLDAWQFLPSLAPASMMEVYAILGGTPAYLLEFDEGKSLADNIKERVLARHSFLFRDVEFVLREELDEPRNYFSIIHSISKGNTTMGKIINDTGLDKGLVSKYIRVLVDLHVLERRVPVTEHRPDKSRKGIYVITDNYFRFWFRHVHANPQYIEQGLHDALLAEKIMPDLDRFVGPVFEDVCIAWMKRAYPGYIVGRWWDKGTEIDILALNKPAGHAIAVEVKWSTMSTRDVKRVHEALKDKARLVDTGCARVDFLVVGKSVPGKRAIAASGIPVFDLDDIIARDGT